MYKIFEKIAHIILNIILVIVFLIVLIVGYNYIQLQIMNKDYTNFFGYTIFEIKTGSMAKTLNVYDVILVKITKDVKENDIITFKKDNDLITHRIMKINGDKLVTKGDANNTEDEEITKDAVIGKVVSVYPRVGIWAKVFTEPNVLISIFITLVLIGLAISKDKTEKIKNERNKNE